MLHRKIILPMVVAFLVALTVWTDVSFAADADAPLTDSEARQFEEILIGVYESAMEDKPHFSSGLNVIQNSIVAYNSDRLNYKTDVTQLGDKYVARDNYVGIVRVAPAYDGTFRCDSFGGNAIYISQDLVDFCNQIDNSGKDNIGSSYMRSMTTGTVYNDWMLAFLIAHEMGHGYDKDLQINVNDAGMNATVRKLMRTPPEEWKDVKDAEAFFNLSSNPKYSYRIENDADTAALNFVRRTGVYSGAGGALAFFHRYGIYEAANQDMVLFTDGRNPHPTTASRAAHVKQYITERSGGRISVNDDGTFRFDGRLISVPSIFDADRIDRAYYVASQLAEIIGDHEEGSTITVYNLEGPDYSDLWAPGAKRALVMACEHQPKEAIGFYVIDRFDLTKQQFVDVALHDAQDTEEEKYVYTLCHLFDGEKKAE